MDEIKINESLLLSSGGAMTLKVMNTILAKKYCIERPEKFRASMGFQSVTYYNASERL